MEVSRVMVRTVGIGERLRNAREAKRLTLDDAAAHTRIRPAYLHALEEEEFGKLPGPIYAKGFLRAYAATLGLDADELVAVYPEAFAPPQGSLVDLPAEIPIRPVSPPSRLRRVLAYVAGGILFIAVILGYVGYQGWRAFNTPPEITRTPPGGPAPSAGPEPLTRAAPATGQTPASAPPPRTLPSLAPPGQPGPVSVTVRASGTTWVRITSDGRRLFEGLLHPGDARAWSGRVVTIRLGNAPVAEVEVNGQHVFTPAGLRVWQRTFTAP